MNPFFIFLITARDYIKAPLNLISSAITPHGWHHSTTSLNKEKSPPSRKIYLTDLDDTFIDWKVAKKTTAQKLMHKFISRPSDEKIELFDGAEDFIKSLKESGVKTAIISNKSHSKLLAQAKHHSWGKLFDGLIGHDRAHAFTMRKHSYSAPSSLHYANHKLPTLAIEKLLGEKLKPGMEKIEVVFAGDRPNQDIATANALNEALKKLNPASSCTSILFNSRGFSEEKIKSLPKSQQPNEVAANYSELAKITDKIFGLSKAKEQSKPQKPKTTAPQKEWVKTMQSQAATSRQVS